MPCKKSVFLFHIGIVVVSTFLSVLSAKPVISQTPVAFMVSPYYGTKAITQNFSANHQAIDFGMEYERILAAESGIITFAGWFNDNCHQFWNPNGDIPQCGFGLYTRVQHSNYRTIYAHLSAIAFNLGTTSDPVRIGEVIGTSGHTGYSSGPHLHFQTQRQIAGVWNNINPFDENGVSLWKYGEWAIPSNPVPEPVASIEMVIDDNPENNSGFSKGRGNPFNLYCPPNACPNWTHSTTSGYSGDMYFTTTLGNDTDYWARWQPDNFPGGGGLYEILVYVPDTHATTWRARYTVRHDNGYGTTVERTAVVDQFGLNNHWVSIGFYAMRAGDYVYTTSATGTMQNEPGRELAVDAIKFRRMDVIYVPLYKFNITDGWISTLTVRNNGGPAAVRVVFYNSDGSRRSTSTYALAPNQHGSYTFANSAHVVIEATQDVTVSYLLERINSSSGAFIAGGAYEGVKKPEVNDIIPLVHRNNYGWNSQISLQNTANANVAVDLVFRPSASCGVLPRTVPANGSLLIDTASLTCLGSNYVGSVQVSGTSTPLALADMQYRTGYVSLIASASAVKRATALFAPLIQNNNFGWTSGFNLQNATDGYRTLSVDYYRPGGAICKNESFNANPYETITQYPAPSSGCTGDSVLSARFYSTGYINAQVNQIVLGEYRASGYRAIARPTSQAIVPYVRRDSILGTGLQIRNAGGSSATVLVEYYDAFGNFAGSESRVVAVNGTSTIYPILPAAPFIGSAVVTCTNGYPIAVAVNHVIVQSGATGDTIMSHIAPNR